MTLALNIVMTVFATLSFSFGISYFIREKETGRIRLFILFLGLFCGFANAGYVLLSVVPISKYSFIFRDIGLIGVNGYMYSEVLLLMDQLKIKSWIKKTVAAFMGFVNVLMFIFHGTPDAVAFFEENGFTSFRNSNTIGYYFQCSITVLTFIVLLSGAILWIKQQKTKRGLMFIGLCFVSNILYLLSSIPYYLGVRGHHPAFFYCLGTTLAYVVIWGAGIIFSGFNVTTQMLSNDIFENIDVGLLAFGTEGELVIRNEYARRELNISSLRKQGISQICDVSPQKENEIISSVLEGNEENIRIKNSETGKIHNAKFSLKKDSLGDPLCIICLLNDITKEENMIAEVIAANEAKSDFLASMSHEIRTPINAVLGMNELIIRESSEEKIISYATDVEHSGRMLLSLINDILDFSKIESGKMEIVPVKYDLSSLINDVVSMLSSRAKEKKLELNVEVDESIPNNLTGDEIRIRQIIVNLLTNAIKYTEKGYVKLTFAKQTLEDDRIMLVISVKDTGKGIKEEDQKVLFDSFTRVDEVENRSIEGTGLGLALTKSFVAMMEGRIELESVYGEGSTFTAYIVQKVNDFTPIGNLEQRINAGSNTRKQRESAIYAPDCKLLVVDDIKLNCKVFCGLLKQTKIKIDVAYSGLEAIEKCKENKYDIIYMDHRMPNMDGIECHDKIIELDTVNKDTPFIMLTANAIAGMKEMYIKAGFADFLSKPVDYKYLEKSIVTYAADKIEKQE